MEGDEGLATGKDEGVGIGEQGDGGERGNFSFSPLHPAPLPLSQCPI